MSLNANPDRLLFIGGHRKSGTSMVRDLFDGHAEVICYPPDLTVFYAYFPQFLKDHQDIDALKARLERIVVRELELSYEASNVPLPAPIDDFRTQFFTGLDSLEKLVDMKEITSRIYQTFRNWAGDKSSDNKLNILKETTIEVYYDQFANWFPQSQFLQIMRDPRDNYAALKAGVEKKYKKYGEDEHVTLMSLLNRLGTSLKMGLINQEKYDTKNYHIEKFENITSSPEKTMKDLCQWLGLSFDPKLLQPSKLGQPTKGNNFDGKDFSRISNSHVNAWKQRITEEEAKVIEFYLGDLMEQYGYTLEFTKEQASKAASTFYEWSNYKYFYFDRFQNEE